MHQLNKKINLNNTNEKSHFIDCSFEWNFLFPCSSANRNFRQKKVYRATHTKVTELKHTKLKVNFDYQKEQMNGEEWLTAAPFSILPTN
jgi:hypothetical protein